MGLGINIRGPTRRGGANAHAFELRRRRDWAANQTDHSQKCSEKLEKIASGFKNKAQIPSPPVGSRWVARGPDRSRRDVAGSSRSAEECRVKREGVLSPPGTHGCLAG